MNRTIVYQIEKEAAGQKVEHFLKKHGYSSQNIAVIILASRNPDKLT